MTGESPKELARIPVRTHGTFDSELSFTTRQSETPIPIGRQVMQVTGFDEDGNQTVVDMVVNIGQGAPAPQPHSQFGMRLEPAILLGSSVHSSSPCPIYAHSGNPCPDRCDDGHSLCPLPTGLRSQGELGVC